MVNRVNAGSDGVLGSW